MKKLLSILGLVLVCVTVKAAIYQNSMTTNSPGRVPNTLGTSANPIYPLLIENPDGSGSDRPLKYNALVYVQGSNLFVNGAVVGNGGGGPTTNYYSTIIATNIYTQNGSHNTMNISNYLTVSGQYVYPLVAGTGITFATNTISAGKTNLTISSAGGSTAVTTLTYSGTNIVGADMSTNGMSFYLLVTNHCLLGTATFSNLPAKTAYQTYTFCFQQDSAGGYVPKLTNSIWVWADGNQPVIKTNAGAVSYIYAHTGLATNSTLVGTPNINIQ